jgi:hypothetical protein
LRPPVDAAVVRVPDGPAIADRPTMLRVNKTNIGKLRIVAQSAIDVVCQTANGPLGNC